MKAEIVDIDEIQEIIIAYANGDFSKRMNLIDENETRNVIAAGINMLGEELQATMISRDYFSSIYNAISDIMFVFDKNWNIIDINQATQQKLGLIKTNIVNTEISSIIDNDDIIDNSNIINEKNLSSITFETDLTDKDNIAFPVSCSISKIRIGNELEHDYLLIAKDITEKKNQEQKIFRAIVYAQENERKRLAYDLHDSFGQELNAIRMFKLELMPFYFIEIELLL